VDNLDLTASVNVVVGGRLETVNEKGEKVTLRSHDINLVRVTAQAGDNINLEVTVTLTDPKSAEVLLAYLTLAARELRNQDKEVGELLASIFPDPPTRGRDTVTMKGRLTTKQVSRLVELISRRSNAPNP
jgi:hypothetical protein